MCSPGCFPVSLAVLNAREINLNTLICVCVCELVTLCEIKGQRKGLYVLFAFPSSAECDFLESPETPWSG